MAKIVFDEAGKRFFKTGVEKVVLFPYDASGTEDTKSWKYGEGVPFNGCTQITVKTDDADSNKKYADDILYLSLRGRGTTSATLQAFMYPDEFAPCIGYDDSTDGITFANQARETFGLCYKKLIGNDEKGLDYGYELHFLYGCTCNTPDDDAQTIEGSPDAPDMQFDIDCIAPGSDWFDLATGVSKAPTAHIVVRKTTANATKFASLEAYVYGTDGTSETDPLLPSPKKIYTLMHTN